MNLKRISILRKVVYLWRNIVQRSSYVKGHDNHISFEQGTIKVKSRIQVTGNGNRIIVQKGAVVMNVLIRVQGNDNTVYIHSGAYLSGAELWVENNNCRLEVGDNTFIGHHSHLACTEDRCQLLVGKDGMISSYVHIRTGDSHSILDLDGNRINKAKSVSIGNHVWIGEGAKVLKGVIIQDDSVIATGSIVTRPVETKNVLLAGVPARIIKENITWDSERL